METFKQGEVTARIDERGIDLGNINVNLYTMDNSTAALDIHIKKRNIFSENKEFIPVNLNQTTFKPVLHLIAEDGSIFTNEELEVVKAEEGHVRYNLSDYVTKHVGRVQAKLFLIDSSNSTDDSSHVADFYFKVNDSGITKAIGKEVHVDMLDDIVERIMLKDIEHFRGPKGDKGDTGPQGPQGEQGPKGDSVTVEDTGWINMTISNDVTPSTSSLPKYKIVKVNGVTFVSVFGTISNLKPGATTQFASLPDIKTIGNINVTTNKTDTFCTLDSNGNLKLTTLPTFPQVSYVSFAATIML